MSALLVMVAPAYGYEGGDRGGHDSCIRPAPDFYVGMVQRRDQLNSLLMEGLRELALGARVDQDGTGTPFRKDLASASGIAQPEISLGMRNLFGVRRLGVDLRTGWLVPGRAFRNDSGDTLGPALRGDDKGFSVVAKFRF